MTGTINKVIKWGQDKGILSDQSSSKDQFIKLCEEQGELAQGLLKNDRPLIIDSIGDMTVVLILLATMENLSFEQCLESAYKEIAGRTGKMINGTFVKDA